MINSKITDKPGHEEVELTRQFGNETIKIVFSIADLNSLDESQQMEDDSAIPDEDYSAQSGGAQSKSAVNAGRTAGGNIAQAPEDQIAPADTEDGEQSYNDEDAGPSFPVRVNVTIEKDGKGALQIETVAQDGMIMIDNVYFYVDGKLADVKTADLDFKRRGLYMGPPFGNLDEDLQVHLERYLDERGVNTELALFVPDYIDWKEQKEYMGWLNNVKGFVSA
jgi:complement component 1 Q subcomponent-binding protein, mitochondrial